MQAGLFGASRRLLRTLWSQSVWDAAALYGGVGLFLSIAAGIVIRRTNYFVPVGTVLAPAAGLLWNASRAACGSLAPVFRRPTAAVEGQGGVPGADAASERPPPDDSQWAESDWELDEDADAATFDDIAVSGGSDSGEVVPSDDGMANATASKAGGEPMGGASALAAPPARPLIEPIAETAEPEQAADDAMVDEQQPCREAEPHQPEEPSSSAEAAQPGEAVGPEHAREEAAAATSEPSELSDLPTDGADVEVPPAVAARLAEIETAYQEARVAVERAAAAHDVALQRGATAPAGSEAAAAAGREADTAAEQHGAAVEAAQAALREAAELQEEASGGFSDAEYEDAQEDFGDPGEEEEDTGVAAEDALGSSDSRASADGGSLPQQSTPSSRADDETVPSAGSDAGTVYEETGSDELAAEDAHRFAEAAPAAVTPSPLEVETAERAPDPALNPPQELAVDSQSAPQTSSAVTSGEGGGDGSETARVSSGTRLEEEPSSHGSTGASEPAAPTDEAHMLSAEGVQNEAAFEPAVSGVDTGGEQPQELRVQQSHEAPRLEAAADGKFAADAAPAVMEWRWEGSEEHPQGAQWVERCFWPICSTIIAWQAVC